MAAASCFFGLGLTKVPWPRGLVLGLILSALGLGLVLRPH